MMGMRDRTSRQRGSISLARLLGGLAMLFVLGATPATASLLPPGFFDGPIAGGKVTKGGAAVEADHMNYDAKRGLVSAVGAVRFSYNGNTISADRIDYDPGTGDVTAVGHVQVVDTGGNRYTMESLKISGKTREAFLDTLTITTPEGAMVTAGSAHYGEALQTVFADATYSPCGLCVDSKGARIGWKVKAARIVYDRENGSITAEQPSLELLGVPVAWIPWFWAPDPTQPRKTGLRMPSIGGDANRGLAVTVPYFIPAGENIDIILSPTLMTRQGFLMQADLAARLPGIGEIDVRGSAVDQLDPGAYGTSVGNRSWRGAIQTTARFTPAADWTAGWSYAAFTDNQYLGDYGYDSSALLTNSLYATELSDQTWFDARLMSFRRLGNFTQADDDQQALVAPQLAYDQVTDLAPGYGRLHFSGELLALNRAADDTATYAGVKYVNGNQGAKQHLMLEGAWENQAILPGGVAATPYLGVRLDAANYQRGPGAMPGGYTATPDAMLLSATPIAAIDMRWPLMARNGDDIHLFEPIGQLVYRGSDTTMVGVTNDDAQSFVFDDTNLFSYNRFSGIDRQETGLRANIGGHYSGNFANGGWLDLIAGESFQLAGFNALGFADTAQTGTSTGLGSAASFIVAGARGGFDRELSFGGKLQIDPATPRVTRAGLGVDYNPGPHQFSAGGDYIFIAANSSLGMPKDQHQVAGRVGVPITEYWTANGSVTYDLAAMSWADASVGATYDDGYLLYGASANATPTSWGIGVNLKLKGPDHADAF